MARFYGAKSKPYGGRQLGGGAFGGDGGGAFAPDGLAGLLVWHKADAITGKNDGDAISQWDDSTANGFHQVQATGAKQPTYQTAEINGLPVVQYDGVDDTTVAANFNNADASITMFLVGRFLAGVGANARILALAADASIFYNAGDTSWKYFSAAGSATVAIGGVATNATVVAVSYTDLTSFTTYRNGTAVATDNPTDSYAATADLVLGGSSATTDYAKCQIGEVLIYNSALSAGDRGDVTTYLGDKWGITVA